MHIAVVGAGVGTVVGAGVVGEKVGAVGILSKAIGVATAAGTTNVCCVLRQMCEMGAEDTVNKMQTAGVFEALVFALKPAAYKRGSMEAKQADRAQAPAVGRTCCCTRR